ncbi:sialin-like [Anneissia japonica]|uniref:sialin-like n=1 Tax=Anneissia japonica TaxID=1529436 RepID=UPI0014256528|nr:sialin-like [Anneissia japonica]
MKRYIVILMIGLANCVLYCMRLNLNIAITEMVRKENTTEITNYNSNSSEVDQRSSIPTFEWDELRQQRILGAFYYGYAVMPIPGGWLARKKGGKRVMVFAVLWTSLLTALIPWAAGVSSGLLIVLRILDGLGQGSLLPASYVIFGKWTVPDERSSMISISFSGMTLGVIISSYVSGWISSAYEFGGWPMSFYIYICFGLELCPCSLIGALLVFCVN